ncbi:hypothetical protein ABZU32_29260 [Sphaerisporangium sp. NPDC005288]|uniref:AraC-like ligand-binding domain-containing protein n=1 Tax=Sphaerisporangium sp. NPDC005288 TaxID=3155114 RepID=UPI0033BA027E
MDLRPLLSAERARYDMSANMRPPCQAQGDRRVSIVATSMSGTANSLSDGVGLSASTVHRYISLLEEVFLTKRVPAWSRNLSSRATSIPKLAFVDSGVAANLLESWIRSDSEADFQASVRVLDCAGVQISVLTHPMVRAERSARLVRQYDPEVYLFQLIVRGGGGLAHHGRDAVFGANHFVVIDSSRPFQGWRSAEEGVDEAVVVQLSRASLGLRSTTVARLGPPGFVSPGRTSGR